MIPISAIIISKDEEKQIERCLKSLEGIADEIIVVDSESTDRTAEICREAGCKVVTRHFHGFGAQRQYATSLASHRYVLTLDADEVLSPALRETIMKLKEDGLDNHRVYRCSRMNFFGETPVFHCGWYPDRQIRLFDRTYATWDLRDVFEKVIFPNSLQPIDIEGDILHYRCSGREEYHKKVIDHAYIGAHVIAASRDSVGVLTPFMKGMKSWFECYVLRKGALDGRVGRLISREEYLSTYMAYRLARKILKEK